MERTIEDTTSMILADTSELIHACFEVMAQLRPHLKDCQAFVEQVKRQQKSGYHLVCIQKEEKVQAVIGYRFLEFLAWGKVLYIDDLITDSQARANGYAGKLLQWTIEQAKKARCDQVHLDSGPQRHDAHRLYLNHGFKIIGYHFALELS